MLKSTHGPPSAKSQSLKSGNLLDIDNFGGADDQGAIARFGRNFGTG